MLYQEISAEAGAHTLFYARLLNGGLFCGWMMPSIVVGGRWGLFEFQLGDENGFCPWKFICPGPGFCWFGSVNALEFTR